MDDEIKLSRRDEILLSRMTRNLIFNKDKM
jgi:hypothetical protein